MSDMPAEAGPAVSAPFGGILHAFVAFDWGEEVDLERARHVLPAELHSLPRRLRTPPSIAYQSPPLRFALPPLDLIVPVLGRAQAPAELMLFDFGSASLAMRFNFRLTAADLSRLAGELADPTIFVQAARDALKPMFDKLRDAIFQPEWIDLSEEYFVFQLIPEPSTPSPPQLLAQFPGWLAGLVRLEAAPLSDSEIAEALRLRLSYSPDDLIVTDWTAAVVVDRDCAEILETMAFANLQLLEFRHIDKRLDGQLKTAYGLIHQLAHRWLPIWRTHARRLRVLRELHAEFNEMFERASDALTLVGDPYVARVYQQLAGRFHLDQWGQNIRRSIAVLDGIYQSVSGQAATYRIEALEIIVVLLILFEIVLALYRH
ncbi:MAG: hypothetical protein HY290_13425 [Planctomycetia bacterium]|nr:hypothetical protein [Planctomycetia bacterium]